MFQLAWEGRDCTALIVWFQREENEEQSVLDLRNLNQYIQKYKLKIVAVPITTLSLQQKTACHLLTYKVPTFTLLFSLLQAVVIFFSYHTNCLKSFYSHSCFGHPGENHAFPVSGCQGKLPEISSANGSVFKGVSWTVWWRVPPDDFLTMKRFVFQVGETSKYISKTVLLPPWPHSILHFCNITCQTTPQKHANLNTISPFHWEIPSKSASDGSQWCPGLFRPAKGCFSILCH